MEWPSERVPQGGLFHPAKVTYSKDTHDLINLLMEEAKLTIIQRKKINYHLRNGEPFPIPKEPRRPILNGDENQQAYEIMLKARNARRSLDMIKASGAYKLQRYIPKCHSKEPVEKAKRRLQELMSGVKEFPENDYLTKSIKHKFTKKEKHEENRDRIAELLADIYERADWLAEMESLGEGKKHRDIIHNQIADKLREIKILEKRKHQDEMEQHLEAELNKCFSVRS